MKCSALQAAAEAAIARQPARRVLSFEFSGNTYFIKRKLSNHRNQLAKAGVSAAFWCEVYKISVAAQYFSFVPSIVFLHDDYFIMKDGGLSLQRVAKDPAYSEDLRTEVFQKAGQALSCLHAAGLHHGRPALRDIVYDQRKNAVTLLDWENERTFLHAAPFVLDVFLFVHSCFREGWKTTRLIDTAIGSYGAAAGGNKRLRAVCDFTAQHPLVFAICRDLAFFHWIDVQAVNSARLYFQNLTLPPASR